MCALVEGEVPKGPGDGTAPYEGRKTKHGKSHEM